MRVGQVIFHCPPLQHLQNENNVECTVEKVSITINIQYLYVDFSNQWAKSKEKKHKKKHYCEVPHEKCHYGQRPWTMLTTLLLLLHTRAGTVVAAADGVGAIWGHRGQQGVARRNW